jgi:hypothetical protein
VRISFGMLVIIGGALFARLLVRSRICASDEVAQFGSTPRSCASAGWQSLGGPLLIHERRHSERSRTTHSCSKGDIASGR